MPTIEIKAKGSDISYVYQTITDEEFNKLVDSLLYNAQSQQFFVELRDYIRSTPDFRALLTSDDDVAVRKIRELSHDFNETYSQFADYFMKWAPRREYLIKILKKCAERLDTNFTTMSWVRIVASAADLAGNIMRILHERELTIAGMSVGSLSLIGLISLFLEKIMSKAMVNYVKETFEKDQEFFMKIKEWFKQTEELDRAVKSFFPYGIDEDIARKINEFSQDTDEFSKIFMSVVASNVQKDIKLCKNKEFLDKAELFASSESGLMWFHKVIAERDPVFIECFSVAQEAKIQHALKASSDVNQSDVCLNFPMQMCKQKAALDALNILVTITNMVLNVNKEKSDPFRDLAKKAEDELWNVRKLVLLLRPCELIMEIDDRNQIDINDNDEE